MKCVESVNFGEIEEGQNLARRKAKTPAGCRRYQRIRRSNGDQELRRRGNTTDLRRIRRGKTLRAGGASPAPTKALVETVMQLRDLARRLLRDENRASWRN